MSVGDEDIRAIRLAALAPVFRGHDLDELLDFAAGVKNPANARTPAAGPHDSAPDWYEYILCAALTGADAPRLVERALEAASRMGDYPRWLLLRALLPHLNHSTARSGR